MLPGSFCRRLGLLSCCRVLLGEAGSEHPVVPGGSGCSGPRASGDAGYFGCSGLRASGGAGCFGPAAAIGLGGSLRSRALGAGTICFRGTGCGLVSPWRCSSCGMRLRLRRLPRRGRPEAPDTPRCKRLGVWWVARADCRTHLAWVQTERPAKAKPSACTSLTAGHGVACR